MQFITIDNRIAVENFQVGYFYTITFNNHNYIITTCTGIGDNFVTFLCSEPELLFDLNMQNVGTIATIELYGGGSGTTDYNNLSNKPAINSVTLSGNKTSLDLGLQPEINSEHKLLSDNVDDTGQTHKFATVTQLEQIETNKNNILSIQKVVDWLSKTGSINILNATNTTATTTSWVFQNAVCTLQANKEYILRYTTDKGIRLNFVGYKGSTQVFSIVYYASDGAGTFFKKFTPTDNVDKVGLYASDLPNGDTTISDMMIYSADLGELSFVPYAPSNIDLYKMIQAL